MAVYINYNGFVAPLDPASAQYYDTFTTNYGMTLVFKLYGAYYLITTGNLGARQAGVDTTVSPAMFWTWMSKQYKLNSKGQWEKTSTFTSGQYIAPIDDIEIIYYNTTVYYLKLNDTGIWPSTYRAADAAATVVTEGLPVIPTILAYGWNHNGNIETDVPDVQDMTCPQITEEESQTWLLQLRLVCQAMVPDEGRLSIEWYRDGELVATSEGSNVLTSKIIPAVDQLGTFTYFAAVTHYVDGLYTTINCQQLNLTVVEYDFGNYDPDTGEDTSGLIPPGVILPGFDTVTDIKVTMYPDTVCPGGHAIFEVQVIGEGDYSEEYTLELNGQESGDTFVNEGRGLGNIWVAEDETADFVLLTVTSVENPLIQTSEMLYIDHETVEEPAATSEQLQRAFMQGCATARAYLGKLKIVEGTMLSVDQTNTEEAPEDIPSQLKRSFWKGFLAGVGSLAGKGQIEYIAYLEDGILHIVNAPAVLNDGILEVR